MAIGSVNPNFGEYQIAKKIGEIITQVDADTAALTALGAVLRYGAGDPSALAGTAGQFYLRTGTPGTPNQRIYICTVTGAASAATWVALAV